MDTNGEIIPVHTMKVYGTEEIQHHTNLMLVSAGGELSDLCP
jgi:hypothetical protein